MGLFGQTKPKDPRETIREMKRKMRSEQRGIDRNINQIKREEMKVNKIRNNTGVLLSQQDAHKYLVVTSGCSDHT